LTVVDVFTRESLAIEAGQSLKGEDLAKVSIRIEAQRQAWRVFS
jgi:putative transposase